MSEARVTNTFANKPRSSLLSRLAFAGLGLLLIGIILVYAVLYFGSINGEEFSPDSFKRRRFAYLEFPLIGVQITPISHNDTTNDLEKYLSTQKLLPKAAKPQNRWDLVLATKGSRNGAQGDSRILCQYSDAVDKDGDSIWLTWSEKNVELAKVLWPAIAKVARQEFYSFVPDLFVLARSASGPEQLQQRINQTLADKFFLTAETFEALDQPEIAAELFTEVLNYAPDRIDRVQGRDKHPPSDL
ncbi:MAG: hypothetical protein H6822_09195 [Planctomycetaceae bacterium]|nr:hypothetical protein [Planctomycetales bacterium]MCB9922346.1 hypothetical protein [Planctomycetaceae bacterium]